MRLCQIRRRHVGGHGHGVALPKCARFCVGDRRAARRMIRFLQPEWFWAFTVLPLIILWRGRRGPVAALEYSDVSLARELARSTRSRIGGVVWLLPIFAAALMIVGLARPQRAHSRTEVTTNGIDIVLGLDV